METPNKAKTPQPYTAQGIKRKHVIVWRKGQRAEQRRYGRSTPLSRSAALDGDRDAAAARIVRPGPLHITKKIKETRRAHSANPVVRPRRNYYVVWSPLCNLGRTH